MLRWLLASFHLLGLAIGLGSIWVRARALGGLPDPLCLRRALRADAWWGIAALLWIGTGLPRLLAGTEKPTAFYTANHLFWLKLGLFTLIFVLEFPPMITLTGWRRTLARGEVPRMDRAALFALTSRIQVGLVIVMLFVATAMARGYGAIRP